MNWILPQEILMESDLTWQSVAFIGVCLLNGLGLFAWVSSKAFATFVDAWEKWSSRNGTR